MKTNLFTLTFGRLALALLFVAKLSAQTAPLAEQVAMLLDKKDLAAAEALLIPLTTEGSRDAVAFFQLGGLRSRQQRVDDAIAAYEKATQLDPTKAEHFSQYAVALSTKMQGAPMNAQALLVPKMKRALEKSVAIDPNHVPGLIGLIRYYTNAPEIAGGSIEKAQEIAKRLEALNPFLGAIELGQIAEHAEEFATALSHFDAASKLQPNNAIAHAFAGRMLVKLGRSDDARVRLQRALELDPKRTATRQALDALNR
jgi:tetratricopeptide (TPR) repeat protein